MHIMQALKYKLGKNVQALKGIKLHSRPRRVREASRTHDSKKRQKKHGLIVTYFFFGPATLANLEPRVSWHRTSPPWGGNGTTRWLSTRT